MAGRPRVPEAVARLTGAAAKNPQRHRNRADPKVGPLGSPPKHLTADEADAWREFAAEMPWLARSDRAILEVASRLRTMMAGGEFTSGLATELRQCLNAMGGSPSTRSKVPAPKDDEDDPLSEFVN